MSAVSAVLIASAASVAKVFLIAIVGFLAVKYPRGNPLIPPSSVGMLSRFAFTILSVPLVYVSIGSTLTLDVLGSLWFVPVMGIAVICLSFLIATITERLPFFRIEHRADRDALRIACSFPNVLAIPILVFPSLCEYEVVYSTYIKTDSEGGEEDMTRSPIEECKNSLNAMTFCYFFAFLLMFFLLGNQILVNAGKRKNLDEAISGKSNIDDVENIDGDTGQNTSALQFDDDDDVTDNTDGNETKANATIDNATERSKSVMRSFLVAVRRAVFNYNSLALWAGLITALIAPLQNALFAPGGALRFIGSALESLASALPAIATIITAASLMPPEDGSNNGDSDEERKRSCSSMRLFSWMREGGYTNMYDPNQIGSREDQQTNRRSSLSRMRRASERFGRQSLKIMRSPTVRVHIWFNVTRLLITPAITCGILVGLDCGTSLFDTIPHMSKLVVLLNSSVPSAMLVILSLKTEGLTESAAVVAKVFIPSYILSIFTIAGWASVGLMLSIPDGEGKYFCER